MQNKIDLGEINIPDNWDKINLRTYQKITKSLDEDKSDITDIISILTDKDKDYINLLPSKFYNIIMDKLNFIKKIPHYDISDKIEIDNVEYKISDFNNIKFGEYTDTQLSYQNDKYDFASILAIMCRQKEEQYDQTFINNKFEERKEMFLNQPITKILPLIGFFLTYAQLLRTTSPQFLNQVKQNLNQYADSIEHSSQNGKRSRISTFFLRKKLQKLKKSINAI